MTIKAKWEDLMYIYRQCNHLDISFLFNSLTQYGMLSEIKEHETALFLEFM